MIENFKIRKATLKDTNAIAKLIKEEFNKQPYEDGWTDKTSRGIVRYFLKIGYGFVLIEGKKIIGVVIARDEPYAQGTYINIEELVVSSEYQGKGYGKKLIQELERIGKKKKAHVIYFSANKKSKAFNFYKKLGYKESKQMVILGRKIK